MTGRLASLAGLALMACSNGQAAPPPIERAPLGPLRDVPAGELCVTHGSAAGDEQAAAIREPAVRAVIPGAHGDSAALRFTYQGPSSEVTRLASGQVRRQLGLKLRASDGCNLIYVMWRLAPGRPMIEVSIKRNPGDDTHAECGTGGYRKIAPARRGKLPALKVGSSHLLEAEIRGDQLTARIDGELVWQGELGSKARELDGPAGMRTDNVALSDVKLRAARSKAPAAFSVPAHCRP